MITCHRSLSHASVFQQEQETSLVSDLAWALGSVGAPVHEQRAPEKAGWRGRRVPGVGEAENRLESEESTFEDVGMRIGPAGFTHVA